MSRYELSPGGRSAGKSGLLLLLMVLLALILAPSLIPTPSQGTPAYARRYDTTCQTCHSPIPPRLNNVGMLFRRFGFRLPDSDENGKLTLKLAPAHGVGDAIALGGSFSLNNQPEAGPGSTRTSLEMGEVVLVAGTSLGEHLSGQMIFVPRNGEGGAKLENFEVQGNLGRPESQGSLRVGLAQTNLWHKANDGSLTLSNPIIFSDAPYAPAGDFAGLALGANQVEVEAGYSYTKLNKGKLCGTIVSAAVLNGVQQDGSAALRNTTDGVDVFLQAHQLWGSRNTVGAFYYHGRTLIDPQAQLDPAGPFKDTYTRYGLLGNYSPLDWLDVVASLAAGQDSSGQEQKLVKNLGFFAEADFRVMEHWVAVYRFEQVDPDRDLTDNRIHANVFSTTAHVEDNLFLTGEYRQISDGNGKSHTITGEIRLIY